jgi:uncharacterized protein (TIGR03435 family)
MPAVTILIAFAVSSVIGILRAQNLPPAPTQDYDVVSIHKSDPGATNVHIGPGPQGGLQTTNTSLLLLIAFAYDVAKYQIFGAPGWVSSDRFDVTFTPDREEIALGADPNLADSESSFVRNQQRLQAVLRDRFGLIMRGEKRELPVYLLTQARSGYKLSPHSDAKPGPSIQTNGDRQITASDATLDMLAGQLSIQLRRPVRNETLIEGRYDFTLDWVPDPDLPEGSIFTAITDQLGLRLESTKGPVQVYVVEKIQQPSEN